MAKFKTYLFEKLFEMKSGYVLNFSNHSLKMFILDSVSINIYDDKYDYASCSKANRLRKFWELESKSVVKKLLMDLLEYSSIEGLGDNKLLNACKQELENISDDDNIASSIQTLKSFDDSSIPQLKKSLQNYIEEKDYSSAIDRLHTYCMKYFKKLYANLTNKKVELDKNKPLHSIAGECFKSMENIQSETSKTILKSCLSTLEKFNYSRNNESLAHDNKVLSQSEAKLIISWVLSLVEFIDSFFIDAANPSSERKARF